MKKERAKQIINATILLLLIFLFTNFISFFKILIAPSFSLNIALIVPVIYIILLGLTIMFLYQKNKAGLILLIINSFLVFLASIVNLFTYPTYLKAMGIFSLSEYLKHPSEIWFISYFIILYIIIPFIIIYIYTRKPIKDIFS